MNKILFIVPDFYPNTTGFANAAVGLINSIKKYGREKYDIHVLTEVELKEGQPEIEGISVFRYKRSSFDNRFTHYFVEKSKFKYASKIIDRNNYDMIFFETNTFPIFENLIIKKYKSKVCVRIHSTADTEVAVFGLNANLFQKRMRKKMYAFMDKVNGVVSTSNYYLDFIKRYYYQNDVYKIWNGRHYGLIFNTCGDGCESRRLVSDNVFLTMGKLSNNGFIQKGFMDLLNSLEFLNTKGHLPRNFKLVMIGDGEKYRFVETYLSTLTIRDSVVLVKQATHAEVFEYINKSKAIILLSRYEGQSMFITETISMGKPIIVTNDNGMSNMILDGENGFTVKTGDVISISEAIYKMILANNETIDEMGNRSKKLYEASFSEKAVFEQFDFYFKTR